MGCSLCQLSFDNLPLPPGPPILPQTRFILVNATLRRPIRFPSHTRPPAAQKKFQKANARWNE